MMSFRMMGALAVGCALVLVSSGAADAATKKVDKPQKKGGYAMSSELSIGGADAPDESFFYEKFGGVQVDADGSGNVYVLDNGNTRIQVFGKDGKFVRSLGAEGEGPGEFQIPGRFAVSEAGDVAVFDMGQGRVSVLDETGALKWDTVTGEVQDLAFTSSGLLLLGYGTHGPAQVEAYDATGKKVWSAGTANPPGDRVIDIRLGRQQIAPRLSFNGASCVRAPQGEYVVQVFSLEGAEVAAFTRPFERRAVTAEDMAPKRDGDEDAEPKVIMIKRSEGGPGDGGGAPGGHDGGGGSWSTGDNEETMTFSLDKMAEFMPKHHPDTRGVLAWPDGRVWILTAHDERGGVVTDEWSTDGNWLRRFTVPAEYDWFEVGRDGALYGVTHDDDDYPTIHRVSVRSEA
jgi:hypothetical protein